jgi:hypothetical protein
MKQNNEKRDSKRKPDLSHRTSQDYNYRWAKWGAVVFLIAVAIAVFPSLYGLIRIQYRLDSGDSAILVLGGSNGSREQHAFALANAFDRLLSQPQGPGKMAIDKAPSNGTPLSNTDPALQAASLSKGSLSKGSLSKGSLSKGSLSKEHPIRIWISTGRPRPEIARMSSQLGIERSRIELDYRAIDTVTNFTTMAAKMSAANISTVYVVTDVTHIDRAMIIADVILAYYGIRPIAAPSPNTTHRVNEWAIRGWRDYLRCIIWFYTGKSGAHLIAVKNLVN